MAAPTASLHWTAELMDRWREVCSDTQAVTLHVGAGTFQPVSADAVGDHPMHAEEVVIARSAVEALADGLPVLAMGTTAARTLESLYWWALEWQRSGSMPSYVDQWAPYSEFLVAGFSPQSAELPACGSSRHGEGEVPRDALAPEVVALLAWAAQKLKEEGHEVVSFRTALLIAPGYSFRIVHALITNFHQPQSTLLLLIAAGLGPAWRGIYEHALANGYRFLSYGDANLYRF